MTPGRGLSLEARPPGPKQFDELIGIAWPSEVSRAARMLNPRKRRIRVVWSGGVQSGGVQSGGTICVPHNNCRQLRPWAKKNGTFSDPCCRRINSAVLALAGHSAILAAAGSTQQSLLWQDIQRSLLPQDLTQQSLLWQDIQRSLLPQD
ncbi:hypothetical protein ACLKA6_017351 [Drosophila palustris]